MKNNAITLLASGILVSGLALAGSPADVAEVTADSQADQMAQQEIQAQIDQAQFQSMDANSDGMVSQDEYKAAGLTGDFATMDANQDGQLEWNELTMQQGESTAAGSEMDDAYNPAMPADEAGPGVPEEGIEAAGGDAKEDATEME